MRTTTEISIIIRDIDAGAEMRAVEELQKEVWGLPDLDVVPLSQLVAATAAGGVLLGAFDRETLVGFVYGFVGYEYGRAAHHSHMLAVKPGFRNHHLGQKLKIAQRESVLAQGINVMTWTFDPLQSLNAYFNFNKLGVVSDRYFINFYGEDAASFLHRNGTDRLWVTWLLSSHRVSERIGGINNAAPEIQSVVPLVQVEKDDSPRLNNSTKGLSGEYVLIEIPADINELERQNSELASAWRVATRAAFTKALASGYLVENFYRRSRDGQQISTYYLSRKKSLDDFV
ncbi:MAG: GNAT family N-acetyltransferase [Acidobacteria bacterium]|jgi:predicted GNAT superfamily acetyltransferase|nr:GNAT family N-acetyltransferase [Acidobacteriota bacterium]